MACTFGWFGYFISPTLSHSILQSLTFVNSAMKYLLAAIFVCLGLTLPAQSFYVALVKGNVYYEEVLLKPRTKIELKGNFRFTTKDDYIKISGPTGIHTIRPQEKPDGGYEFLRAVTQELFPAAKPRGSFVLSTWSITGDALRIYAENEFDPVAFVAGERVPLAGTLSKRQYKHLYWVAQASDGKIFRELAKVVDGQLELTTGILAGELSAGSESTGIAHLFYISDVLYFRGLTERFSVDDVFWATNPDVQPPAGQELPADNNPGKDLYKRLTSKDGTTVYRPYPEIIGLGWVDPEIILDREAVMGDMLHFFLASGKTSIREFLLGGRMFEGEDYSSILREQYGELNVHRVARAFYDYLYEHRKDDRRIKELWKLKKKAFK